MVLIIWRGLGCVTQKPQSTNVEVHGGHDKQFWAVYCLGKCRCPLHYTTLHYTPLHYTTLHYTALHYTTLHYTTLHYTTLHYTTLHYTTLHYTTLHYTILSREVQVQSPIDYSCTLHTRTEGKGRIVYTRYICEAYKVLELWLGPRFLMYFWFVDSMFCVHSRWRFHTPVRLVSWSFLNLPSSIFFLCNMVLHCTWLLDIYSRLKSSNCRLFKSEFSWTMTLLWLNILRITMLQKWHKNMQNKSLSNFEKTHRITVRIPVLHNHVIAW